jgi:two-component sensor histidine kinase
MGPEDEELEAENLDLRRLLAKAGNDAAEQEVARKLQRVMLEELHHRVKNILATVQAITSLSLGAAHSVKEAQTAIESRLHALSRVHDLLLQTNWSKAKLQSVVAAAIEPFDASEPRRFKLRMPDVEVAPAAVLPLGLVLNELCTNAVKYGALSSPGGRVEINASIQDGAERILLLKWAEHGGPPVEQPQRRGFGSTLIERAFVAQLQGRARLDFNPAGVQYELEVPLAALLPRISN